MLVDLCVDGVTGSARLAEADQYPRGDRRVGIVAGPPAPAAIDVCIVVQALQRSLDERIDVALVTGADVRESKFGRGPPQCERREEAADGHLRTLIRILVDVRQRRVHAGRQRRRNVDRQLARFGAHIVRHFDRLRRLVGHLTGGADGLRREECVERQRKLHRVGLATGLRVKRECDAIAARRNRRLPPHLRIRVRLDVHALRRIARHRHALGLQRDVDVGRCSRKVVDDRAERRLVARDEEARHGRTDDHVLHRHDVVVRVARPRVLGDAARGEAPRRQRVRQPHLDARTAVGAGAERGVPVRRVRKERARLVAGAAAAALAALPHADRPLVRAVDRCREARSAHDAQRPARPERVERFARQVVPQRQHRLVDERQRELRRHAAAFAVGRADRVRHGLARTELIAVGLDLDVQVLHVSRHLQFDDPELHLRKRIFGCRRLEEHHTDEDVRHVVLRDRHFDHLGVRREVAQLRLEQPAALLRDQPAARRERRRNQDLRRVARLVGVAVGDERDRIIVADAPARVLAARGPYRGRRDDAVAGGVLRLGEHVVLAAARRLERERTLAVGRGRNVERLHERVVMLAREVLLTVGVTDAHRPPLALEDAHLHRDVAGGLAVRIDADDVHLRIVARGRDVVVRPQPDVERALVDVHRREGANGLTVLVRDVRFHCEGLAGAVARDVSGDPERECTLLAGLALTGSAQVLLILVVRPIAIVVRRRVVAEAEATEAIGAEEVRQGRRRPLHGGARERRTEEQVGRHGCIDGLAVDVRLLRRLHFDFELRLAELRNVELHVGQLRAVGLLWRRNAAGHRRSDTAELERRVVAAGPGLARQREFRVERAQIGQLHGLRLQSASAVVADDQRERGRRRRQRVARVIVFAHDALEVHRLTGPVDRPVGIQIADHIRQLEREGYVGRREPRRDAVVPVRAGENRAATADGRDVVARIVAAVSGIGRRDLRDAVRIGGAGRDRPGALAQDLERHGGERRARPHIDHPHEQLVRRPLRDDVRAADDDRHRLEAEGAGRREANRVHALRQLLAGTSEPRRGDHRLVERRVRDRLAPPADQVRVGRVQRLAAALDSDEAFAGQAVQREIELAEVP